MVNCGSSTVGKFHLVERPDLLEIFAVTNFSMKSVVHHEIHCSRRPLNSNDMSVFLYHTKMLSGMAFNFALPLAKCSSKKNIER